ncbi:MAG: hydroxypyruvate isomerase family protein [Terriglobia bacterium]
MKHINRRQFGETLAAALGAAAISKPGFAAAFQGAQERGARAPFRLSVMLWTVFKDLPFPQRLEKVAEAGYHSVELVGEFAKWSASDYRAANGKKQGLGMGFDATSGVRHSLADPSQRDAFLSDLQSLFDVCKKIECPSVIVLSGNRMPSLPRAAQHTSCVEGLKRAADLADQHNINVLLENIDPEENPHYYLTSVAEGFEIIAAVGHPRVKFLCDFYHEQIAEGNLIEKLEKNIDKVGLVHIADVPGRHEPGTGEINYVNIFKKLGELHYNRFAAMEFLPLGDAVKSLRAAREMALRAGRV